MEKNSKHFAPTQYILINKDVEWNVKKIKCCEHTFKFQISNNIVLVLVF